MDIDRMAPASGRTIKEDDSIVNLGDVFYEISQNGLAFKKTTNIIPIFEVTALPSTNQPANDDISIVSSSASDTQIITLWGIDTIGSIQTSQITLTGTTPVDVVITPKWQTLYGAFLGDVLGNISKRAVGTITITEKSGGLTICTIAPTKLSIGLQRFNLAGKQVILENISGNTWFNDIFVIADVTGKCIQMAGRMCHDITVTTYLSLISDGSGSTIQIMIY
jgi:hypothetical protein